MLDQGQAAIAGLSRSVAASLEETRAVTGLVGALELSSRRIQKIVGGIALVAIQTNMLAVSGSVEAARAGEAGRGFALVSADIRSLARDASENAGRMEDLVRDIQEQVAAVKRDLEASLFGSQAAASSSHALVSRLAAVTADMGVLRTGAEATLAGVGQRPGFRARSPGRRAADRRRRGGDIGCRRASRHRRPQQASGAEDLAAAIEEIASLADELQIAEALSMDTGGVLTFTARGEHLALPLACVVEIIRPLATARIPFAPPALLGLVNWRGTVLPVVSLAHRHGGPFRPSADAAPASAQSGRIIVVRLPGQHAGLAGIPVESVASPGQGGHQDATLLDLSSLVAELALPPGHAAPSLAAAGHAAPGLAAQVKAAAHTPSRPPSLPAAPQAEMELVRFTAGKQDYTWPLDQVAEIIAAPPILAALPEEHPAILGAADWRGAVLPLVSLRALLGLPPTALSGCRVIVTRAGGATIGLVVDAVKPILRVPESSIDPLPPALTRGTGETGSKPFAGWMAAKP